MPVTESFDDPLTVALRSLLAAVSGAARDAPLAGEEEFEIRLMAVRVISEDIPVTAVSGATIIAAMRRFETWPSAAEVYRLLTEIAHDPAAATQAPPSVPPETARARSALAREILSRAEGHP